MRYALAALVLLPTLGGCSLIYNESNIPTPAPDAFEPDAEMVADADPSMLALSDVDPKVIIEGQGTGGSRQAIVVVSGNHIAEGATATIAPATGTVKITPGLVTRAGNGNFLAIPITVDVDTPMTGDVPLMITVTQPDGRGGMVTKTVSGLSLRYLPQMTAIPATTQMFAALYSEINVPGMTVVNLAGSERALFRAVGSITLPPLNGDGNDASGTTPGTAKLGGCAGGNPSSPGECAGGGALGVSGTLGGGGGGGAGFATTGSGGTGTGAGLGGSMAGDPMIVAYDALGLAANRPSGGGGGGAGAVGTGGGGGAGAGIVELTAGGNITVGAISVIGGAGGAGGGAASGGGGGAGGVVMLRAGGSVAMTMVSASGGLGGDVGNTDGGAGSAGRIRWDGPAGVAPTADVPSVNRGPAFAAGSELMVRETMPSITLIGKSNVGFTVYTRHESQTYNQATGTFGSAGSVEIHPLLRGGYNELCITLNGGVQGAFEADKCIDVAFIP